MKIINGGICAPKGFTANGIYCGIRKNKTKLDLALIASDTLCNAASVYTQNLVKGAPITVTQENLQSGFARAIICNSGNANTCNIDGYEVAKQMCELAASELTAHFNSEVDESQIIVASTGVIGQRLDIAQIKNGIKPLVEGLNTNGSFDAATAIMTTDLTLKEIAVEFEIDKKTCKIGAIGKGSGMICPNMATMLVFITTDIAISSEMLAKALKADTQETFNMISVDGDTSTNDMVSILANGRAGNKVIDSEGIDYQKFCKVLSTVTTKICTDIAADGEGATKLLECTVFNARTKPDAKTAAKAVIKSSLFKAAMFGADANWGRALCAIGYSGANVDIRKIDIDFESERGRVSVCKSGRGLPFSEKEAKEVLSNKHIKILVNLNDGGYKATAWGCDLTYDYVKINGDYRT